MVQANEPRIVQVDVAPDISGPLVQGLNRFAFDLYHNLPDDSGSNRIFSPYSISLAFSMVYAGARGNTETEMAEVMHYLSQESQHPAFNALDQRLGRLGEVAKPAAATPEEAFRLSIANSVWGQQGFPFEEAYLATLARHYGAGLQTVDFANHPDQASQLINDWISDQTEERIRDMVPEGAVSEMTRLVLANAIYFKAVWLFPFNEKDTSDSPFTLLDGSQEAVPLMQNNTVRMPFFEGDGYHAAIIPYRGDKVDMLVILPAEGQFEMVEGRLSPEMLTEIRQGAEVHDVRLTMPKFDYDMELDLVDLLSGMGMADAFHGGADFSGIGAGLSISEALHKATITVDEEGTEAAAATMIAMEVSAMEGAELSLDHPFIYALIERESGVILFLGRVLNPAA
jgi:serpin B